MPSIRPKLDASMLRTSEQIDQKAWTTAILQLIRLRNEDWSMNSDTQVFMG
jgi:hypothetical protein